MNSIHEGLCRGLAGLCTESAVCNDWLGGSLYAYTQQFQCLRLSRHADVTLPVGCAVIRRSI